MNNMLVWPVIMMTFAVSLLAAVSVSAAEQTREEKIERAIFPVSRNIAAVRC